MAFGQAGDLGDIAVAEIFEVEEEDRTIEFSEGTGCHETGNGWSPHSFLEPSTLKFLDDVSHRLGHLHAVLVDRFGKEQTLTVSIATSHLNPEADRIAS